MSPFILFLILFIVGSEGKKKQFADLVQACRRNDPKINDCAKQAAQTLLPILADGVRELNLIPLDPLKVPSLDFGQETGPVSLQWKFQNATIKGSSSARVQSLKIGKDLTFEGQFLIPRFELGGKYVGKGKILLLPIEGTGFGNVTTIDMLVSVNFKTEIIKKKNIEYLNVEKIKVTFKIKKSYLSFNNLFGGNKELGMATNKFLNENSDEIIKELRGTLEDVFSELTRKLLNSVFNNIPYSQILPKE